MAPPRACALLVASLILTIPLAAQQKPDTTKKDTTGVRLVPIEVVGTIQPAAGPNVISNVPARVTILTGKQVDAYEPRILSDVLAQQAGFSLYDDLGSAYKLNLQTRGFFGSPVVGLPQGVSVFLDGVRQNEPDAAEVNFDLMPMQYIRRIELLSGTASLLGRNSLGGSINLVTERGDGPIGGELELQGGSFGTFNGNGSISGGSPGGIDYFVGGGYNREDGWRQATGAHQYNGFVNVGRLTETWGLRFQGFAANSYARTAGSLPQSVFDVKPDSNLTGGDYEDLSTVQAVLAGYRAIGGGRASLRAWYRRTWGDRLNINQPDDPDAFQHSRNSTFGWATDYRWAGALGSHVLALRVGTDGSANSSLIQLYADSAKFGGDRALTTHVQSPLWDLGAFVAADLSVGRATFSAGTRLDYVRIPFRNRLDPTNDTTSAYTRLSPRGGVSVDLGRGLTVYGSVGAGFRAPALIEVACADPSRPCVLPFALGDDPPIEPVTLTTYEAGGTWLTGPLSLSASLYLSDVRNEIVLFPSENVASRSTIEGFFGNIAKTRRAGAELGAGLQFGKGHSLYANYAWTRATFETTADIFSARNDEALGIENEATPGDRLPLVPEHQLKFGAIFQLPADVVVGFDGRWIGKQFLRGDEANATEPLEAYFVGDAKVTWQLGRAELTGLVTNLFNARYASFGTFNINQGNPGGPELERFLTPGAKRQFRVIVRYAFGGRGKSSGVRDLD